MCQYVTNVSFGPCEFEKEINVDLINEPISSNITVIKTRDLFDIVIFLFLLWCMFNCNCCRRCC